MKEENKKNKEELFEDQFYNNLNKKEEKNEIKEIKIIKEHYNKSRKLELNIIYKFGYNNENDTNYDKEIIYVGGFYETISKKKLFGERFVKNNKNICTIIINGKEEELRSYIPNYKNYLKKGKLEIKLRGIENIKDSSYMFAGCLSLSSLQDISPNGIQKISIICHLFFIIVNH